MPDEVSTTNTPLTTGTTAYDSTRNCVGTVVSVSSGGVTLAALEDGGDEWTVPTEDARLARTSEILADRVRREHRRW
jgi:hypothetical protein